MEYYASMLTEQYISLCTSAMRKHIIRLLKTVKLCTSNHGKIHVVVVEK